jgi:hypothetical protein
MQPCLSSSFQQKKSKETKKKPVPNALLRRRGERGGWGPRHHACFVSLLHPFVPEGRSNDIFAKVKLLQLLFNSSLQGSMLRGDGSPLIYRGDDEA